MPNIMIGWKSSVLPNRSVGLYKRRKVVKISVMQLPPFSSLNYSFCIIAFPASASILLCPFCEVLSADTVGMHAT